MLFRSHVRDEVTADLIGAPQVGDVVEHQHGASATGGRDGRRARHEHAARVLHERQLAALSVLAVECRRQL